MTYGDYESFSSAGREDYPEEARESALLDDGEEEMENILGEEDEVCEICGGTGEIDTMEAVWPGEPHMAPIGTRKCVCQIRDDDDEFSPD